jgi:5-methylcytosine-specific restriction endonuclease McrA
LVESLGNCDKAHEHNELDEQDVIDDEDEDKKSSCCPPYKVAEQGCLDEFHAVNSVAEGDGGGGGGGSEVGLNDDRIAMAAAYAAVAQPSAEHSLLQNGFIKDELVVDAEAEQGEDAALCLSVAMDTDSIAHEETASEQQVQDVNACSSIALSGSVHHQTDKRTDDDIVSGKTSPTVGECIVSPHDVQQNLSISATIPLQSDEIEPHTMPASLIPSQGAEAEPHTTSAGSISSQGADVTNTTISSSQLGENKSNASAYKFKHDGNSSVKVCASAGNGEHAKDSMEDMHNFQPMIKEDISVSTAAALEVEQHCIAKEFCPAMTSSVSATSMPEGKNALSPKPMTLDIIAESIYSASSESDQTLKDAALQCKHAFKQRNVRQVSHSFQSFKARCFSKKSLTLKKSVKGSSAVIPSNAPKSAHGTITNICVQCGKHFTNIRSLKRHRMRHRSSVKIVSFKCSYCWKRFSTMASLDRHLISLHVPSVASCETCHKRFTTLDSFTLHQLHGCVHCI